MLSYSYMSAWNERFLNIDKEGRIWQLLMEKER